MIIPILEDCQYKQGSILEDSIFVIGLKNIVLLDKDAK